MSGVTESGQESTQPSSVTVEVAIVVGQAGDQAGAWLRTCGQQVTGAGRTTAVLRLGCHEAVPKYAELVDVSVRQWNLPVLPGEQQTHALRATLLARMATSRPSVRYPSRTSSTTKNSPVRPRGVTSPNPSVV